MSNGTPLYEEIGGWGADVYYSEGFRNNIEYHLPLLKQNRNTIIAEIPQNVGLRFEYDFYGLLTEIKIPKYLQWITMRLNDMTDPTEFRVDRQRIRVPDRGEIDKLKSAYTTIHKI